MSGKNTIATASISCKVMALLDASQTVKLWFGSADEGSKKGNSAQPAVEIVPACTKELAMNAAPGRRMTSNRFAAAAPTMAKPGAISIMTVRL